MHIHGPLEMTDTTPTRSRQAYPGLRISPSYRRLINAVLATYTPASQVARRSLLRGLYIFAWLEHRPFATDEDLMDAWLAPPYSASYRQLARSVFRKAQAVAAKRHTTLRMALYGGDYGRRNAWS